MGREDRARRGREPQDFLNECREAAGPTKRQWEQHQKEMEEVRKRIADRKAGGRK